MQKCIYVLKPQTFGFMDGKINPIKTFINDGGQLFFVDESSGYFVTP
jgi:hypothetical protein